MKKSPPSVLLAVDPGMSTGWYIILKGVPKFYGTCRSLDDLMEWLNIYFDEGNIPDIIIMEKYKLFQHKALQQSGSKMEVSQAEGIVKMFAAQHKIPVVEQFSSILPIAVKWTKKPLPKNHNVSHHIAALNHGMYYLIKNGMAEITLEEN